MTLLCVHGAGLEDVVWGLICVPSLAQGCVQNANPFQMCFQTTVPRAQAEDGCLLGSLQLLYGVMVCLVAVDVAGPVGLELALWRTVASMLLLLT